MRTHLALSLVVGVFVAGCSRPSSDAASKRRFADKEVNTRHLKGTTDVLQNYRYGERPGDAKAAAEKKGQKPQGKAK
jgi:hypothetical protein